ncbi:hypothetical protein [Effusibacillus pohliae]|uniref:hypothetical protein n=1 Tax=Effusibacillus pohliae TaxID=232270 RepID=UPI00036814E1|nr:hypothetical protein [Effusibacillus pohliae]
MAVLFDVWYIHDTAIARLAAKWGNQHVADLPVILFTLGIGFTLYPILPGAIFVLAGVATLIGFLLGTFLKLMLVLLQIALFAWRVW